MRRRAVLVLAVAVLAAACGDDSSAVVGSEPTPVEPVPSTGDAPVPPTSLPALGADGRLSVGEPHVVHRVNTHCGVEWLLVEINGQLWRSLNLFDTDAEGVDPVPTAWGRANDPLDLVVELLDPTTLAAFAVGTDVTVRYEPDEHPPGCE